MWGLSLPRVIWKRSAKRLPSTRYAFYRLAWLPFLPYFYSWLAYLGYLVWYDSLALFCACTVRGCFCVCNSIFILINFGLNRGLWLVICPLLFHWQFFMIIIQFAKVTLCPWFLYVVATCHLVVLWLSEIGAWSSLNLDLNLGMNSFEFPHSLKYLNAYTIWTSKWYFVY